MLNCRPTRLELERFVLRLRARMRSPAERRQTRPPRRLLAGPVYCAKSADLAKQMLVDQRRSAVEFIQRILQRPRRQQQFPAILRCPAQAHGSGAGRIESPRKSVTDPRGKPRSVFPMTRPEEPHRAAASSTAECKDP